MSFWKAQAERISQWGLLRTLNYYLFGVLLDKLGITVCVSFKHEGDYSQANWPANVRFTMLQSESELTNRDREILAEFGDASRLTVFQEYSACGDRCGAAHRADTELACYTWVGETTEYPMARGQRVARLHDGATFPACRGQGIFPALLAFICQSVPEQEGEALPIYVDCLVVNYASRRGLLKAGFIPCGHILRFRKWAWAWPKKATPPARKTLDVVAR